jgi:hypothetical protein
MTKGLHIQVALELRQSRREVRENDGVEFVLATSGSAGCQRGRRTIVGIHGRAWFRPGKTEQGYRRRAGGW